MKQQSYKPILTVLFTNLKKKSKIQKGHIRV
jgi:hypothetical protein